MADADPKIADAPATVIEPGEPGTVDVAAPQRRWVRLALMLAVPLAILIGGVVYWLGLQGKVSTDDAYVKQDKVSISAEVGGKILQVYVKNGDHVKAGDLLYRIDPEPFQIQLDQATAAIAAAQANVTALANSADLSGADIAKAREDIAFAQSNFQRQQQLWKQGFTTKAAYDAARHAVEQGQAELKAAQASQAEAQARVNDMQARLRAAIDKAKQQAKQAADDARKATAYAALWLFITLLVGAFCASLFATWGGRRRDL